MNRIEFPWCDGKSHLEAARSLAVWMEHRHCYYSLPLDLEVSPWRVVVTSNPVFCLEATPEDIVVDVYRVPFIEDGLLLKCAHSLVLADDLFALPHLYLFLNSCQHRHFLALHSREDSCAMQCGRASEHLILAGWSHDPWIPERRVNLSGLLD